MSIPRLLRVACKRPITLAAGMAGEMIATCPTLSSLSLCRQLMAETLRVLVGTRLTVCGDERWVDRDADYVVPGGTGSCPSPPLNTKYDLRA